ncbi:MAG: hypothetical protein DYH08_16685 [Actinobacteria bacterium ATB1]|nr:hypothetical protein [Actinobacteria bacterium ATB1]
MGPQTNLRAQPTGGIVGYDLDVRRLALGHFEVRRDGVRLAEVRSVAHGARPGWIVRYRAGVGSVPHVTHQVFTSRAAAIASVSVA